MYSYPFIMVIIDSYYSTLSVALLLMSPLHSLPCSGLRVEGAAVAPVTEGQRVTLSCSTRCLLPGQPSYIWYHNKGPVAEPESTMNKLVLDPVSLQHAGNYSCSVRGYRHQSPEETLTVSCIMCILRRATVSCWLNLLVTGFTLGCNNPVESEVVL